MNRQVRVTVEGTARTITLGADRQTLRVEYPGGVWLINEGPGVTVEDVTPERVWTDEDVVQNEEYGYTLVRQGGQWAGNAAVYKDSTVNAWVRLEQYRVLRNQAGESA